MTDLFYHSIQEVAVFLSAVSSRPTRRSDLLKSVKEVARGVSFGVSFSLLRSDFSSRGTTRPAAVSTAPLTNPRAADPRAHSPQSDGARGRPALACAARLRALPGAGVACLITSRAGAWWYHG